MICVGRILFLLPNQQLKALEGNKCIYTPVSAVYVFMCYTPFARVYVATLLNCRKVPRVKSEEESRKSRRVLNAGLRAPQSAA